MCKKFEGINFGPNIFGQQLLEFFRELSEVFTQILLTKRVMHLQFDILAST